jgi:hypothetical protein
MVLCVWARWLLHASSSSLVVVAAVVRLSFIVLSPSLRDFGVCDYY